MGERLGDLLRKYRNGPLLKQCVVGVGLPRVEPDRIEEEPPGYLSRIDPNESECGRDHDDGDNGVGQQNQALVPAVRGAGSLEVHNPRGYAVARPDHELDLATR